jgi:hypothetical protein
LRTNAIRLRGYEEGLCGSPISGMNGVNASGEAEEKAQNGSTTLPKSLTAPKQQLRPQPTPTLSPHLFFPAHPFHLPPANNPTAYKEMNELVEGLFAKRAGNEPGDPVRGAAVLVDLVRGKLVCSLRYVCSSQGATLRMAFLFEFE